MSFAKFRDLKEPLDGIDERVIELFEIYQYKPTPRANVCYLGTYDKDLKKKLVSLGYHVRAEGHVRSSNSQFTEFTINKWDYWKIRKIIFNMLRYEPFHDYYVEILGSDYKDWVFKLKVPSYYYDIEEE